MQDDLLSTKEAAEYLGITPGRVRQLLRSKRLEGVKIGDAGWAIRRVVLEAFAAIPRKVGRPKEGEDA